MRAYIAISNAGRTRLKDELKAIQSALVLCGVDPFVFVDQYTFNPEEETAMMQKAMEEIDQSDLLIAAASEKAIGIGIEAGYARAKGKPVIYIRHNNAEHSTTLSGISDYSIIYPDLNFLSENLARILKK